MCLVTELEQTGLCLSCCHGGQKILEHMIMRTGVRRILMVLWGGVCAEVCGRVNPERRRNRNTRHTNPEDIKGYFKDILINVLVTIHPVFLFS